MNKILDIMYELEKNKYSLLEENGHRKEISKQDFYKILKANEEVAEFTGQYSLFIGRWQPLHEGHIKLMRTALNEGCKICIGIRDSKVDEKNPYSVRERVEMIRKEFASEIKAGMVKYVTLPDIKEVVHGRKVGWGVREIVLDEKTESISATKIREQRNSE